MQLLLNKFMAYKGDKMHSIYSKLKSVNAMSGKIKGNIFLVTFEPDKKTPVKDAEYDALMSEDESTLKHLLNCGDFVEDAESATAEISTLKGEIKKLELALKKAEASAKQAEKDALGITAAEDVLMKAEDALGAATDAESKKIALVDVKDAKKALITVKKAAKG